MNKNNQKMENNSRIYLKVMITVDKIMNYLIFLCFIYLLYISFKNNRSIFTPSNFFILVWFINFFILMFFVHDFYLYHAASAFILLMCVIVYMGSYIGMDLQLKKKENNKAKYPLSQIINKLKPVAIILSLAGFCVIPLMIADIKGDLLSLFNLKYLRNVSMYVSYLRYKEEYQFPISVQMFLGLNYFAALLNGVYFGYLVLSKKSKHLYIYFIPLITSILISIITTEKAVIIYTVLLFLSSFMVAYNALAKHEFKISLKNTFILMSLFLIMMIIFIYVQMSRYGLSDFNGVKHVIRVFKVYAFGHISAFSIWFQNYLKHYASLGFGRFTFAGLFSFFHIYEREPGIFTDFSVISPEPLFTNVYTAFRGLIIDFSMIGTAILILIFSILAGIAYSQYKNSILAFIYLILFYCITVLSLFTSLLNYNTLIAAFFLLTMTFFYYHYTDKLGEEK